MHRIPSHRLVLSPSFGLLRGWLLTALGLSVAACGGNVTLSNGGSGGSTGTAGTGAGGTTSTGGSTGGSPGACLNPQPILQANGEPSGYVKCSDGSIDRVEKAACTVTPKTDTCQGTEDSFSCHSAADCTAKPYGSCQSFTSDGGAETVWTWCGCQYQCHTDADCDPGFVCACAGVATPNDATCIQAVDCTVDSDCPSGECGYSEYFDGCGTMQAMYCRGAADTCRVDGQCAEGQQCAKDSWVETWSCLDQGCAIGRPLLVGNTLLFAPAERRADWADEPLAPETASLTPEVKAALAAHFTAMAAMEHASIGSFARFSLELMALGAPPALLHASHQAGADEIVHARLAYSLATAYSGQPTGPGRLPITGVAPSADATEIVRALVREACVGETVAAAEALALSTLVQDPALRTVFARVSEDEARHAELGWRTLSWMLGADPSLAAAAEQAFSEAVASISSAPLVPSDVVSPDHGLLSSEMLGSLRHQAAAEIVNPCRRALFAALAERSAPDSPARVGAAEGAVLS